MVGSSYILLSNIIHCIMSCRTFHVT